MLHPLEVLFRGAAPSTERSDWHLCPTTDVVQTNDKMIVYVELPGVKKSEIELTLADATLTLTGTLAKPDEYKSEQASFRSAERRYGTFSRQIPVGQGLTEADVKASMSDGLLRLEMPKQGKAHAEKLKIEVA